MFAKAIILFLILTTFQCHGEFVIPEVTLEAYEPKGFRASIPGKGPKTTIDLLLLY
jgi:hypothetical protein